MGNPYLGFVAVGISVLGFGSNFIPVKRYETGDGIFFQWILCLGIWLSGFVVNVIQGFPEFVPFAMLGGFLWCTGNIMSVPVIKSIGMGLGICLWGLTSLLVGWCSGTFGLFDLKKETVPKPLLNYFGVIFACLSILMFLFVKSEGTSIKNKTEPEESKGLLNGDSNEKVEEVNERSWIEKLDIKKQRIIGVTLALVSGVFYGTNFDPPQYVEDHEGSQNGLDYVFSHFTGIFITSTFYFLLYCVYQKNKPKVYPEVILPGIFSGALWAIAQISWFIANSNLSLVITFPIVSTGPGLLASLWGIFIFKEIRGRKNYLILTLAFIITLIGVILISFSRF